MYGLYVGENTKNVPPEINILLPTNFDRLIKTQLKNNIKNKTDITPLDIIEMIKEITQECQFNNIKKSAYGSLYYDKLSPNILIKKKILI